MFAGQSILRKAHNIKLIINHASFGFDVQLADDERRFEQVNRMVDGQLCGN
jgi:hypothetical protein